MSLEPFIPSLDPSTRKRPRRGRFRGFTLLEALVTLLVMAIVLPVVMNGITLAVTSARIASSSLKAASLAENKLNELVSNPFSASGLQQGEFTDEEDGAYTWVADIVSRDSDLMEIKVEVHWTALGRPRQVSMTTLKHTGGGT